MTDKTEKQASPGPFDDKNLGELFQIALVNAPSPSKNAFNWGAFKPEAVKSPADLPPYLVFGPLNEGTFLLTPEGWRAEWSDAQQKAKITLNWGANTHRYTATQVWEGEEGSATEQPDTTPLIQVFAMLYENGLPSMWDQLAKKKAEEMYHLTWLVGDKRLPTYFAAPDGIFRVISFPVMIKNLRHAQSILKSIAEKNPSYGFYPIAGTETLTLFLASYFIAIGLVKCWAALSNTDAKGWGLMLFSAIVSLLLGGCLWWGWPQSATWIFGIFVAIELIFDGWTALMFGLEVRALPDDDNDNK